MYDKLVAKVNSIDSSGLLLRTKYDIDKTELEDEILIAHSLHSEFVLKANYIIDKSRLEKKIPDSSQLVKNTDYMLKLLILISLVKKTDYDIKITEIEKKLTDHNLDKYTIALEFNKLTS